MAELKLMRYLQEEERLILSMLSKFNDQLSKLKVEELNIKSAIREKQFQETTGATSQEAASSSTAPALDPSSVNMENIDLSVREELNLLARASFLDFEEEEEEDDGEGDM
ncbi:snRNA-activating protein complex subunit 5-like [Ornithodoros turicata]|uniref:snRNA-activating protein complex subunit 5-like n=1 Tax=Ornithodoros turicata TaxID=34597 RepID=UPI00313904DB